MPEGITKKITVSVDAELHAEIKAYLEAHEMTMGEFIALAAEDELHPKFKGSEEKSMENVRTLAFQVPENLFQRIKEYLKRNGMTQKQFVLGLIEDELERDEAVVQGNGEEETAEEEENSEAFTDETPDVLPDYFDADGESEDGLEEEGQNYGPEM